LNIIAKASYYVERLASLAFEDEMRVRCGRRMKNKQYKAGLPRLLKMK
jgi:hypothetical protein